MGKRLYQFGAVFAVALLLGSVLIFATTSADAAAAPNYTVSKLSSGKTLVRDSAGRTVISSTDSSTALQTAIDRTPSGGMVLIKSGQYTLSNILRAKAGVTISGEGSGTVLNNGGIDVSVSNAVISSLSMRGTCRMVITPSTSDISNIVVKDVSATVGNIEAAFSVISNAYKVSNLQFIRDAVTNSGSAGFVLSGRALISDVTFTDCKVTGSGISSRFNDWVSGFVLVQNAPVTNLKAIRCEASNNWENGFFLKPSTTKTNVVLQDCVANNNGQKPLYQEGYGYFLDGTVAMTNCVGTGNKGGLTNLATPPVPPPSPGTSKITLTPASSSVQTGSSMSATGVLTGASGIAGASVSVSVTLPSGSTVNPAQGATVTTDSSGKFTMSYTPTSAGTYKFTATYAGNSAYTGSSATASFTATAPPTPSATYDYVVSSNVVKTASGATVYTGSSFTAALQWAVAQAGKTTYVPAGTYSVTGTLTMATGTTLMGAGPSTSGTVLNNAVMRVDNTNNVAFKNFRFTGNGQIVVVATGGAYSGYLVQDVTAYQTSTSIEAAFEFLVMSKGTITNVDFIRCQALSTAGTGFLFGGDGWKYATSAYSTSVGWIKDVYMEDCLADHCGYYSRTNPWVVGIDLAETCNVDGFYLLRCTATYNLESGFHCEWFPVAKNLVLENCVANYNGAKDPNYNNGEGTYGPLYGMGFYWNSNRGSGNYMTLINCQGVGNALGDCPNGNLPPSG